MSMKNAWLMQEKNAEAVSRLYELGIRDADLVGISNAGRVKYTNKNGQVQVLPPKQKYMQITIWVKGMIQAGYGEHIIDTASRKRDPFVEDIIAYKQSNWEKIQAFWAEIWKDDSVVLTEKDNMVYLAFEGPGLSKKVFIPILPSQMSSADEQKDKDYSGYFIHRLNAACLPVITSLVLQTDHLNKLKEAKKEFNALAEDCAREIFAEEFPSQVPTVQHTKTITRGKIARDQNGIRKYDDYVSMVINPSQDQMRLAFTLPDIGDVFMLIDGPSIESYVFFEDEKGMEHKLTDDAKICTSKASMYRNATDWKIRIHPFSATAKEKIRKEILVHAVQMTLNPAGKVQEKIQKTYEKYAIRNGEVPDVRRMDIGKGAGPDYSKAYDLIGDRVAVRTAYGIINEKGQIERTPFARMLDTIQKSDSAMAKKKAVTDELVKHAPKLVAGSFPLNISFARGSYPYIDGAPVTMQVVIFGKAVSLASGEIIGRTTTSFARCLKAAFEKTYKDLEKRTREICLEKLNGLERWANNPMALPILDYIHVNEEYVTENAVVQALRGTAIQLHAHLYSTPECGKLAYFPKTVVEDYIDSMIRHGLIGTKELRGDYGYFNILKLTKTADEFRFLMAWADKHGEDQEMDDIQKNPYHFHHFLQKIQKKAENGEDITQDQILLLQNLGNYYFTGYYFNEITNILADHFSEGIKAYLEMTVFAAQDDASLTDDHKKLIAKVQTTVKKIVREKKKKKKEEAGKE